MVLTSSTPNSFRTLGLSINRLRIRIRNNKNRITRKKYSSEQTFNNCSLSRLLTETLWCLTVNSWLWNKNKIMTQIKAVNRLWLSFWSFMSWSLWNWCCSMKANPAKRQRKSRTKAEWWFQWLLPSSSSNSQWTCSCSNSKKSCPNSADF